IAENAVRNTSTESTPRKTTKPAWKVPEPASKGARARITPAADQAPVQQPPTREDVFGDTPRPVQATELSGQVLSGQALGGTRTLSGTQRVFTGEPISLSLK